MFWKKKPEPAPQRLSVLRHGQAMRVVFYYPGEEGAFVDNARVTLFENGIVHVKAGTEETTTSITHCEILWTFEVPDTDKPKNNIRLLHPKDKS